jgi:tripartite-type tricarboxylate transporter receptor subunit TctC
MKFKIWMGAPLLAVLTSAQAFAQTGNYPNHPIRLICVHAPGGTADTLSRLISEKLTKSLGQPVVVDNRPGAATMLGAKAAATSPADGYTLLMASVTTLSINPSLYAKMSYDPVKDFTPVALVAATPSVLAVSPTLPVHNVKELIALAKANPGKYNYSSPGAGTSAHLAGALFASMAGIDIVHVPYKASAGAITDIISGQVQMTFENSLVPYSRSGKLRPLGIGSAKRSSMWPELPTIAEQGLPGYESTVWYGVVAPAGTPPEIVNKLNTAINQALAAPDVKEQLKTLSGDPLGGTPQDFSDRIKKDLTKWAGVIKSTGVSME